MNVLEYKAKFLAMLDEAAAKIVPFVERSKSTIGALKGSATSMGDIESPIDVE